MGMLSQPFIYFNDNVGRVIPNARMFFYDAGTTTPKNTYTSKSLANANPWPLVADSAGRFPVAWLENSGYRVVVQDDNGVTIEDRDDINTPELALNATSAIYFEDETDLALLLAQNGQTVNPSLNDALVTTGSANPTDGEGADWVVVPAATGTPGVNFINLANGLQAQRVDPYFRLSSYLQEIEDAGASAQEAAVGNLNSFYKPNYLQEISDDGEAAKETARTNLGIFGGEFGAGSLVTLYSNSAEESESTPDSSLGIATTSKYWVSTGRGTVTVSAELRTTNTSALNTVQIRVDGNVLLTLGATSGTYTVDSGTIDVELLSEVSAVFFVDTRPFDGASQCFVRNLTITTLPTSAV